eukprot:s7506_g1.t1
MLSLSLRQKMSLKAFVLRLEAVEHDSIESMIRCAEGLSTVPRCQYSENFLVAAMESEAVDDVIWLLQVLRCEKTRWQEVTFEEYKWLKIRRKQFLRNKHPDKARDDSAKFECTKLNQRFNNAWDELNKRL